MSKSLVTIGHTEDGKPVRLDVDALLVSKLLLSANSGGGKSWALRKLIEQVLPRAQGVVLDREGEFVTLREKFDMLLVGPGGDIPTDLRASRLLARRLLETEVSAVVDLSELKGLDQQRQFVGDFFDELINVPKSLWHPCFYVLDETHLFVPEVGSVASSEPLKNFISLSRKRGFCPLMATQRLSKFHKDAAAELNNRVMGRTSLDVDQKRTADDLGMPIGEARTSLRELKPGDFYGYGPALVADGVVKFRFDKVETSHARAGEGKTLAPPKPSAAIQKVLAKEFTDLPAEAQQEAKDVAAAKRRIEELERLVGQVNRAVGRDPKDAKPLAAFVADLKTAVPAPAKPTKRDEQAEKRRQERWQHETQKLVQKERAAWLGWTATLRRLLESAMAKQEGRDSEALKKDIQEATDTFVQRVVALATRGESARQQAMERLSSQAQEVADRIKAYVDKNAIELPPLPPEASAPADVVDRMRLGKVPRAHVPPAEDEASDGAEGSGKDLPQRILNAIAWWEQFGVKSPSREQVAFAARAKPTGGYYRDQVGRLKGAGKLEYPDNGHLALTAEGRAAAGDPGPATFDELVKRVRSLLGSAESLGRRMFDAVLQHGQMTREELGAALSADSEGGYFRDQVGRMKGAGFFKYPTKGSVDLSDAIQAAREKRPQRRAVADPHSGPDLTGPRSSGSDQRSPV